MSRTSVKRSAFIGASIGAGVTALAGTASVIVAAVFARKLVTPDRDRPDDAQVISVSHDLAGRPTSVVLSPTDESLAPGRYGLFWDDERGHARIGEVLGRTDGGDVIRAVDAVTRGELEPGPARWSGYYVDGSPQDAYGIPTEELGLETEFGRAPAWVTRAGDGTRWAVLVHGRGARRGETLRAVPVLTDLGISCVIPSYRNDPDGPVSSDGRYALGLTEWQDVDVAIDYAIREGATSIDLLGWSMGGAIVMQLLARSDHAPLVRRVVLDGPVLDWADVMAHHARQNRLHPHLAGLAARLLGDTRTSGRTIGVSQAVDLRLTNWVTRADEIVKPTLIIHSVDDEFVPYGPSQALAEARPDLVHWERWTTARHVREWNTDPVRWERSVRRFLSETGERSDDAAYPSR